MLGKSAHFVSLAEYGVSVYDTQHQLISFFLRFATHLYSAELPVIHIRYFVIVNILVIVGFLGACIGLLL